MFEMRAKMITVGLLGAAVMLPIDPAKADQLGHASWYSLPANITANGERMDPNELTAAHRSLPFGTRVLVENLANGRSVVVRINDRGPFVGGRIIDLSKAAAASIGMIDALFFKETATTETGGAKYVANLLNSGTFLKRAGRWQVVNWQSTRMPRTEGESKADVTAADAAFHQAMLAGDGKKLAALSDEAFIWTRPDGAQITQKELVDDLTSGQLKFSKLENSKVTVSVFGDTAVVRGESLRQRSSVPGRTMGDAVPAVVNYTLTFVNQIGGWKAVALHTSGRPN